jgi:hypothetical protein
VNVGASVVNERRRWNRFGVILSALVLTIVLAATLTPASASTPTADFWCVACGEFGGLDVLNNIVLFLPLGAAFALAADRRWRSILACVAVTVFIESMQIRVIPGRDASLSDILANSLGGAIGVELALRRAVLLRPRGRAAQLLALAGAAGFALVMMLSSLGFRPASIPRSLWVQWTPDRASFEPFTGRLLDFDLDGIDLPARFFPPVSLGVDRVLRGPTWHATVQIGTENLKPRRSVIARIAEEFTVLVSIEQYGWDLACQQKTLSGDFRFRSPKIAIRGALSRAVEEMPARVQFTCSRQYDALVASTDDRREVLRLSPSLGWLFVTPLNITVPSQYVLVSVLWLIALAFPAGYWIGFVGKDSAEAGADGGRTHRARLLAMGAFGVALVAGFLIVPWLAGTAPGAWWEWASAVAGALVGSAGARVSLLWRARFGMPSPAATVTPVSDSP